ncbi:DEAD/DEAH box helicase family protein, partial [Iamia sp.]|uniref:DEAD/DEAH box helicase family protein n=1 Tax=Iamia sp. TaxID=2722710 RepID=UPI002B9E2797
IRQLRRYANQRDEVEAEEGVEPLFWTNQVVVATTGQEARLGSFTSGPEHFLEWKDTAPVDRADVASDLGKEVAALTSQELLTAGVLRPSHLLDLVRHFSLLMPAGPRRVKVVPRYQQYRAVHRALDRLRTGDSRIVDGHVDRRGGVIWHTQGSGKSLTMVFLVRAMRSDPDLRRFKVVVVTDRTDLQIQLGATAELSGETVKVARSSRELRTHLSPRGPGLVMAMIQKYRADLASGVGAGSSGDGGDLRLAGGDDDQGDRLDDLNTDEAILVLVDEAHRSQGSILHANLLAALPNAARIGFTGTPIIMGARQKTHAIFGPFLDTYTLRQSERDGSTVPIMYEGRTTDAAVQGASNLDEVFLPLVRRSDRRAAPRPAAALRHRGRRARSTRADRRQGARPHPPLRVDGDAGRVQGPRRGQQPSGLRPLPRGSRPGPRRAGGRAGGVARVAPRRARR